MRTTARDIRFLVTVPLFLAALAVAAAARPAGLAVSHRARSLQPGEVVLLRIGSTGPLDALRVTAFDRSFPAWPSAKSTEWSALVGIDVDTAPGRHLVAVTGTEADGREVAAAYPLDVVTREFPTRQLTVDSKYVSPPDTVRGRIDEESRRMRAVLEAVSPDRSWAGRFGLPVPGKVVSEFGKRSVYNGESRGVHSGTDFRGAVGTRVRAPNAGRVALAADLYYSGKTVLIDHGQGLYSHLGHLSAILVTEGEAVIGGQVVGRVGATGVVTGPHLHWSVRLAGTRVDPLSLVHVLRPPPARKRKSVRD